MGENNTQLAAGQKRAAHPDLGKTLSLVALRDHLPFCFAGPEGLPPSPKRHCRSPYHYLGPEEWADSPYRRP